VRNLITIATTFALCGLVVVFLEHRRRSEGRSTPDTDGSRVLMSDRTHQATVRAAGRIEGRTEAIELRARVSEQVREIHVREGQWVGKGEVLVSLDADRLTSEHDLADALLSEAEAKKLRLENGYRESEIETARSEYEAKLARLAGAEKSHQRAVALLATNAISTQELDDRLADVDSWRATSAAAQKRLELLELPPRDDDLLAATAAVRAARSRREIAQINLDRSRILAPCEGKILAIEAEPGELTGPDSPTPLVVISDTSQLRAMAEVDEYDALKIALGQACQITADGAEGILAEGQVVEIEPRMNPKKTYGQWAGERTDTFSRRVWIALEKTSLDLPVGLPVDVYIEAYDVQP
jgi:multidrug resistance efflux pump